MITRKDYMADSANLHQAYYLEVALAARLMVPDWIMEDVRKSTDPNLNDIALGRWDALAGARPNPSLVSALKARGDVYSIAGSVCAYKALAKHLATEPS